MTTKMTMTADNVFCLAAYRTGHLSPPEIEIPLRRYDEASQAQRRRAGILMSKSIYSAEGRHSIPLILDQIEALEQKFGENTPRGGILFKSPFIFDIQGVLCLDSYGRGNVHNCQYDPWRTILERQGILEPALFRCQQISQKSGVSFILRLRLITKVSIEII